MEGQACADPHRRRRNLSIKQNHKPIPKWQKSHVQHVQLLPAPHEICLFFLCCFGCQCITGHVYSKYPLFCIVDCGSDCRDIKDYKDPRGMKNAGQRWLLDWIFEGNDKEHRIDANLDFVCDLNLNDLQKYRINPIKANVTLCVCVCVRDTFF